MARKNIEIDQEKLRSAIRKLSKADVILMLKHHCCHDEDRILKVARRTGTREQAKAIDELAMGRAGLGQKGQRQ